MIYPEERSQSVAERPPKPKVASSNLAGRILLLLQRVSREAQILHDTAADEVFLDNAFRIVRCHVSIPRAFGIDDADRPAGAHAQALAPGPVAGPVRSRDVQFLHPALEVLPRRVSRLRIHAIRPDAHEEMPLQLADAERRRCLLDGVVLLSH